MTTAVCPKGLDYCSGPGTRMASALQRVLHHRFNAKAIAPDPEHEIRAKLFHLHVDGQRGLRDDAAIGRYHETTRRGMGIEREHAHPVFT